MIIDMDDHAGPTGGSPAKSELARGRAAAALIRNRFRGGRGWHDVQADMLTRSSKDIDEMNNEIRERLEYLREFWAPSRRRRITISVKALRLLEHEVSARGLSHQLAAASPQDLPVQMTPNDWALVIGLFPIVLAIVSRDYSKAELIAGSLITIALQCTILLVRDINRGR
jgi:hypothetical protein